MSFLSLSQLRDEIQQRATRIGAPVAALPTLGGPRHEYHPGLRIAADGYHLVRTERGQEIEDLHTADVDTLLYWIFVDVTRQMTMTADAGPTGEARVARQLALLGRLEPRWAQQHAAQITRGG